MLYTVYIYNILKYEVKVITFQRLTSNCFSSCKNYNFQQYLIYSENYRGGEGE